MISVPAEAQLTQTGLTLNFDAAQDQNGNLTWESLGTDASRDWTLGSAIMRDTSPILGNPLETGGFSGITASYEFPGLDATNLVDERATSATYSGFGDAGDASLEFWIRLDNTTDDQVIWESGGATNGSALVLTGGQLKFVAKTGTASAAVAIAAPTDGKFHQVVLTIDLNQSGNNDLLSLYVDAGTPVTNAAATGITTWSGTDVAGLGGYNSALGANGAQGLSQGNFNTTLAAGIASMRYYQTALSAAEVLANYSAVTAATVFFDNEAASGLWSTQSNWDTNIQPTSAQNVVINNGLIVTVDAAGETAKDLTIGSAASSSFVPSVTSGAGTLILTGGDLTVSGTLTLGDGQDGSLTLTGGVLNANGAITAGSANSALTLAGGTLNMNGNAIGSGAALITNLVFASGTLDSVSEINGGTGLTKNLVGTLALTGTNTYTGGTSISAGTLALGSNDALPTTGTVTIHTGGTLDLATFTNTVGGVTLAGGIIDGTTGLLTSTSDYVIEGGVVNGILGGAVGLTKSTAGIAVINGTSSYSGVTTVNGGTLVAGSANALNSASATVVNSGGHLNFFDGTGAGTFSVPNLTLASGSGIGGELGGNLTTGVVSVTGTINVDVWASPTIADPSGNLYTLVNAASGLTSGGANYQIGNVYGNTNFTVVTGNLSPSDTQIQVTPQTATALTAVFWKGGFAGGANVWAVSNGSTLSNWATDAGGADTGLVPGAAAAVTISATTATNQSSMILGADMTIDTLTISDTAAVSLNADGHTLTIANSAGNGGITVDAAAGAAAINADLVLGGASPTITHNGANDLAIGGVIGGSGGLIKDGTGTLILTANNTYTGDTNINAGILQVGDGGTTGTLGDAAGTINVGNATLILNRSDGVTIDDDINLTVSGGVLRAMAGINNINGGTVGNLDATANVFLTVDAGAFLNINNQGAATNVGMGAGFSVTLDGAGYGTINRSLASGNAAAHIVKNGTGTWEFTSNANNYAGSTTVNDGLLFLNSSSGGAINNSSDLTINGGTVLLGFDNQIANDVLVAVSGAGAVLDLGANHTDRVGTFTLANGGTITGTGTSALIVNAGDTFELQDGTVNVILTGSAGLNKTTTGTATINVVATYTGETNVASGTLLLDLAANNTGMITNSSGLTLSGGRLLVQGQAGGGNVSSETFGNLTLTANTSSILALDSNTGDSTTLNLGSVWERGVNSLLVINYTDANGSSFVNTGGEVTGSGAMTGGVFSYAIVKDAAGTGFATTDGSFNIVRDTNVTVLSATNSDATSGGINFTSISTDPDYNTGTLTLTSASPHLVNTLVIDTTGGGTLDLNGGSMAFTQGMLVVTGSGAYTIQNGDLGSSNLDLIVFTDATGTLTLDTSVSGGIGGFVKQGGGTLLLAGTSTYTGSTIIGGGTLAIGSATALASTTAVVLADVASANLDITGFNTTIGSLSGGGTGGGGIILGSNTLTVGTDNSSTTYGGVISGTGGQLVKTGDGTLTLTNASTFTGAATVEQGIVNLRAGNGLGLGTITVADGATLQLQGGITVDTGTLTLNSGAAAGQNGGLVNVSGNNTYNRNITINGSASAVIASDSGTLTLDNGNTTAISMGANQLTLLAASGAAINVGTGVGNENIGMGNSTLILDGAGNGNIKTYLASGNAAGILIKNGTGTWTLSKGYSGSNGWSAIAGETAHLVINAGTLKLGVNNGISYGTGKGNVQVNGGILDLAGFFIFINGLENAPGKTAGVVTNSGATNRTITLGNADSSAVFRGTIQDGTSTIAIDKIGTGTQSLIGTNTFTGATKVSGGTLIMSANTTSELTLEAGTTFHHVTGTGAAMNLTNLTLNGNSTLGTELGSPINISGTTTVAASAAITVDVFGITGTTPNGSFILASSPNGGFTSTGATYTLGNVYNATNFTVGVINSTDTEISIVATEALAPLTVAYWLGGYSGNPNLWAVSNGSAITPESNWATNQAGTGLTSLVPGAGTHVILSADVATNQATMALGANMSIDRLTISDTNPVTLNADGYALTLNNSGGGTGIAMSSGAGAATLNSVFILEGVTPTITNDSTTSDLTIGGEISGVAGVTKAGAGKLVFTAANSYTGGTVINDGTLQVGDGGATGSVGAGAITGSGTATLAVNRSGTATFNDTISVPNLRLDAGTTRITADTTVSSSFVSASGAVLETTGNVTLDLSTASTIANNGGLNVVSDTLTIKATTVDQLPASGGASFYYSFNDSGSVFNDDSGPTAYHGIQGTAGALPTYTADGKFGGAVTFNGTDQGFQAGGNAQSTILSNLETVLTYASWIKVDAITPNSTMVFEEGGGSNGVMVWTQGSDLKATIKNTGTGAGTTTVTASSGLTTGWHHVAISYSDSTFRLYLDGVLADSGAFAASLNAHTDDSGIGYLVAGAPLGVDNNFFSGAMDEVYYFDDVGLTSSQIASLANGMSVSSMGALTLNDGATINVDGTAVGSAATLFGPVSSGDATITGTGKLIGTKFNVDAGKTLTVANEITGVVGLEAAGPGTLLLTGTNTYTGVTRVTGGTLSISSDDNLGAVPASAETSVALNGGTLRTTADMAFAANRGITVAAAGGSIETDSGTTLTMNNTLNGAGTLTKTGEGTLLVNTDNSASYTGATVIEAGAVQLATGALTGSGDVTLNGTSSVLLGTGTVAGNTSVLLGTIQPGDPGVASGIGTLTIAADATITGGATLDLQFTHANGIGASAASNLDGSGNLDWAVITAASRNAGTADVLNVTGIWTLSNDATIKLSTADAGTFEKGMAWDLIDWGTLGAEPVSLNFVPDLTLSNELAAFGLVLDTSHFSSHGIIAIVPEPGRMSLIGLGLAAALLRRRRRSAM